MDLTLWDEGEYERFGQLLREERLRVRDGLGMSQVQLAARIIFNLGSLMWLTETLGAELDNYAAGVKPPVELQDDAAVKGLQDSARQAKKLRPLFADITAVGPGFADAIFSKGGAQASTMPDEHREAYDQLTKKWRSRIANVEAGRPARRLIVEAIVDELNRYTAHQGPKSALAEAHDAIAFVPHLGEITDEIADESEIDPSDQRAAPLRWRAAGVSLTAEIQRSDYEPRILQGDMLGIHETPAITPGKAHFLVSPEGRYEVRLVEQTTAGAYLLVHPATLLAERWNPKWRLVGLVIARESVHPEGLPLVSTQERAYRLKE